MGGGRREGRCGRGKWGKKRGGTTEEERTKKEEENMKGQKGVVGKQRERKRKKKERKKRNSTEYHFFKKVKSYKLVTIGFSFFAHSFLIFILIPIVILKFSNFNFKSYFCCSLQYGSKSI